MFAWITKHFSRFKDRSPSAKGAYWEGVAAQELKKSGFRIVARNWKGKRGELDIVATEGDVLVFVEVRSRGAAALVRGFQSITRHKRTVLRDTCNDYLARLRKRPATYRFDVMEICYRSRKDFELKHYRSVPLFSAGRGR